MHAVRNRFALDANKGCVCHEMFENYDYDLILK